jgi:hypothetical protein
VDAVDNNVVVKIGFPWGKSGEWMVWCDEIFGLCGWQVVVVMGIRGANQEMQMAALLDELG